MANKNLVLLTICQVFSFTAPPITVFISGIVGLKISPIASLATLRVECPVPLMVMTAIA